jgi:hypothetical protein
VKANLEQWWTRYILVVSGKELSDEDFLARRSTSNRKDKAAFKKEIRNVFL